MNGIAEMGLGWLFLSAFTSATLLPGSSEVLLGAMATRGEWSMTSLLFWATLGNTLGSMTTWWLGRLAGAGVPALFLVPNAVGPGGEPLTNAGASMAPLLAAAGFRLDVTEPKYRDAATQAAGLSPTAYLLYRR